MSLIQDELTTCDREARISMKSKSKERISVGRRELQEVYTGRGSPGSKIRAQVAGTRILGYAKNKQAGDGNKALVCIYSQEASCAGKNS